MPTKETIVVLRVLDDVPEREWWQVFDMPPPERFANVLPSDAWVEVIAEVPVDRSAK